MAVLKALGGLFHDRIREDAGAETLVDHAWFSPSQMGEEAAPERWRSLLGPGCGGR